MSCESCCCKSTSIAAADPTYVYKLVSHTSPVLPSLDDFPDVLPVSEVDRSSGFIHLSTSFQIPNTLLHFFASDPRVYVLRLPYAPLAKQGLVKWESPEGDVCGQRPCEGLFPHVYNGLKVGKEEVESVWVLEKGEGWKEVLMKDEAFKAWLVY